MTPEQRVAMLLSEVGVRTVIVETGKAAVLNLMDADPNLTCKANNIAKGTNLTVPEYVAELKRQYPDRASEYDHWATTYGIEATS